AERGSAGAARKARAGCRLARASSELAASGRDPSGARNRSNSGRAAEGGFARAGAAAQGRAHRLASAANPFDLRSVIWNPQLTGTAVAALRSWLAASAGDHPPAVRHIPAP